MRLHAARKLGRQWQATAKIMENLRKPGPVAREAHGMVRSKVDSTGAAASRDKAMMDPVRTMRSPEGQRDAKALKKLGKKKALEKLGKKKALEKLAKKNALKKLDKKRLKLFHGW